MVVLTATAHGCGGESEEPQSQEEGVDCSACTLEQVCWNAEDYDGSIVGGCIDLPSACREDRTCDCVDASSDDICRAAGGIDAFPLCSEFEEEPVVRCTITLG